MFTTTSPIRRLGATFAIAGIAALGSVAVAPAAFAAQPVTVQDGPSSVLESDDGHGPDAFIIREHGRTPIFFCDEDKPNQRHSNCEADLQAGTDRF
jgi:hypothetical protein